MKQITHITAAALMCLGLTTGANAACLVEYKAKQDNPLRLEHGILTLDVPCTIEEAEPLAAEHLAQTGWTLLKVLSVSEENEG